MKREILAKLRRQFICSGDDYGTLEADEAQIEMRLFADRAQDRVLIQQFNDGKDPHRMGAAAGHGIPESRVTKEQRSHAKNAISFGLLYGRGAPALARDMGWSVARAEEFVEKYFTQYAGCRAYIRRESARGRREAYCVSHFGRYSEFEVLKDASAPEAVIARAIRQLINRPIQGDASDITWCAGYRMGQLLEKYRMKTKLLVGVHDALWLDYYRKELEDVLENLYRFMTDVPWFERMTGWRCSAPLDIGVLLGQRNLYDMVELKHTPNKGDFKVPKEFL